MYPWPVYPRAHGYNHKYKPTGHPRIHIRGSVPTPTHGSNTTVRGGQIPLSGEVKYHCLGRSNTLFWEVKYHCFGRSNTTVFRGLGGQIPLFSVVWEVKIHCFRHEKTPKSTVLGMKRRQNHRFPWVPDVKNHR